MTTIPSGYGPSAGPRAFEGPRPVARERLSVIDRVQTAAVFYIGAWTLSPPLFISDLARRGAVVAFGLWVICELTRRTGVIARPTLAVIIALVFLAYTTAVTAYLDGVQTVVGGIQTIVFVMFLIFFESARRAGLMKYRWVLWGGLLLLPIWMATTVSALATNRHVARILTRSSEEGAAYMSAGVGGYGLVYSTVLAIPLLLYLMANLPPLSASRGNTGSRVWSLAQRIILGAGAVLALLLVARAGYSIAVAALMLGLITYFLLRGQVRNRSFRIGIAIAISAVVLAVSQTSLISGALDGLSDLAYGTSYRAKIDDLRTSLETDTSVGTVYGRTERYMRSLTLFAQNPIVGTLSFRDVGKHSAVLDVFAQFGLFGGAAFVYLLFATPLMLLRASAARVQMSGAAAAFLIILAVCTIFNDLSASMGFVAYILYPLAMTYGGDRQPGGRSRSGPSRLQFVRRDGRSVSPVA